VERWLHYFRERVLPREDGPILRILRGQPGTGCRATQALLSRNLRVIRHRGEAAIEARQNQRRQRNIHSQQRFNKSTGGRLTACQESLHVHARIPSAAHAPDDMTA
jgi:hypothetical protein